MPSNNSLQNIFVSGGDCLQIKTSADCYAGQTKSSHMNPTLKLGECCRGGSGVGLIIFMMINIRAVMIMYNAWQQLPRVEFNAGVASMVLMFFVEQVIVLLSYGDSVLQCCC